MSSSSDLDSLQFATRQINLYVGLFVAITGIFGNLFNITVFTTLRTFRKTTCSMYLITTSIVNIGALIVIFLRVFYDGFNIGLYYTAFVCKFRFFVTHYCLLISLTSMCLSTIDQFISMTRYRQWNKLRIAHRLIAFDCVFWLIVTIFTAIYYDAYLNTCIITNAAYAKYYTYFQTPVLFGFLPLTVMMIFSVLAFFKIRTIASRQINIVRLSRDRQLSAMTFFHVLSIIISSIPFLTFYIFTFIINAKDEIEVARNQVIYSVTLLFYYTNYSWSFYIYCCVSKRFRKQVIYVLIDIHLNRWRRRGNKENKNQIQPYPMEIVNEHREATVAEPNEIALY